MKCILYSYKESFPVDIFHCLHVKKKELPLLIIKVSEKEYIGFELAKPKHNKKTNRWSYRVLTLCILSFLL